MDPFADRPGVGLQDVLGLLPDIERRCALHLACLRRAPAIRTPCCADEFCFKCKIGSHHEGRTCEEVQREEVEVDCQFCPHCGIATLKTEGCDHMVCLCGGEWQWEGAGLGLDEIVEGDD